MKLIIQIPCFNEERTLPLVFEKMPKKIEGVDTIEYQIIDDGSTDNTVKVAKKLGVHHIVSSGGKNRRWLGRAFKLGVDNALKLGADILVNTDGDNQYPSEKIPDLIKPILEGKAEVVIGDRSPQNIREFSLTKRFLQKLGSKVTQQIAGCEVRDAVSGFRAYSKEALKKLNIVTDYTYTVDTLIQANKKGLDIAWVKINVNPKTRESRLIKSLWSKVWTSGLTILRLYTIYEPFKTFLFISSIFFIPSFIIIMRYLYFFFVLGETSRHLQSLIAGGILFIIGIQIVVLGILADSLSVIRRLEEDTLYRLKTLDSESKRK